MAINSRSSKETGGRGGHCHGGKSPHFHRVSVTTVERRVTTETSAPNLQNPQRTCQQHQVVQMTAAAADWDSEDEGAWVAIDTNGESVMLGGGMPDLESVKVSESSSEDGSVTGLAAMSMTLGGVPEQDSVYPRMIQIGFWRWERTLESWMMRDGTWMMKTHCEPMIFPSRIMGLISQISQKLPLS